VGSGYFLKTMIAKRYALPTQVISALVKFFLKYESQTEEQFETMPVMWHQTLYTLCSSYRPYLTDDEVLKIKSLIKKQFHHLITPEIRKTLASTSQHGEPLSSAVMDLDNDE